MMTRILFMLIAISPLFSTAQTALNTAIQTFANAPNMAAGQLGVCVMNAQSGEVLASYNSSKALTPASTLKTVTTATALAMLGSDYRFQTTLEIDGDLRNGTLYGNIYLKGTGDPTLASAEIKADEQPKVLSMDALLAEFVAAIRAKGITAIEGKIVGDASFWGTYESTPATWSWEDLGNYYGAAASALNFHENLYYLYFNRSMQVGGSTSISRTLPEMPYLTFENEVTLGDSGSGDNAYIFGAPNTYHRIVRGTIPVGKGEFRVKGSMPDPSQFAAYRLMLALEKGGIKTQKIATTHRELQREGSASNEKRTTIHTYKSPSLAAIAKRANEESNNLYCETLLKTMGKKMKGIGTTDAGVQAVRDFWEARGLDMEAFFMEDGSGLSPRNAVSAFAMTSLLAKITKEKTLFDTFYSSLAVGGKTGTAKAMFAKNKETGARLHLKSGSIRRVRAYCGYAKTKSGQLVSFSIMANNFTGKSAAVRLQMETVMLAIADLP